MRVTTIAILIAATTAVFAPSAVAASGTTSAGDTTVTITVNDVAFQGPECLQVPLTLTFTQSGSLDLEASQPGSSNSLSTFAYAPNAGAYTETMQICPFIDGPGQYVLRGTLDSAGIRAPVPDGITFTVNPAPVTLARLTANQRGSVLTVKGKVTAATDRGPIGASGNVTIYGKLAKKAGGKGTWVKAGTTYSDEFGAFIFRGSTSQKLKGALFKVVLTGEDWFGSVEGQAKIK